MKFLPILFVITCLASGSYADSVPHQTPTPQPVLSHPVNTTTSQPSGAYDFVTCENKVKELFPKYLGRQRDHLYFHVMLACSGLEGDPVPRKGWKNSLPNCPHHPPSSTQWKPDRERFSAQFHTCADSCFRHSSKKSWKEIISQEKLLIRGMPAKIKQQYAWYDKLNAEDRDILDHYYPGQQCCYYQGKLITDGPGAGTPDVVFIAPNLTPKRLRPAGPLRAALFHDKFDVEIIKTKFPRWPRGWKDYWDLGWSPTATSAPRFWGKDSNHKSCENFQN